jgi:transposase
VLAAAEGLENKTIAQQLETREATVCKWRGRFARSRIQGLQDAPRTGKPPKYDLSTEKQILEVLDEDPPKGYATWDGPLVAKRMGISEHYVWRVLRKYDISLARRRSWCISTDPEFAAKAAAIIGLYLNPPENAVVLCVDEKPAIQALERMQGWLRLPNGKALTGFNHEYKRHGTSTLFAALEVATGMVETGHFKRRRRREFLAFMNAIVAQHPDREIHVVVDNLNTHKPKNDRWLSKHRNVHFYYTPTHASWLSQVETWFSILWKKALRGASFTSVAQLRKAIDNFIEAYNETAQPFEWKATEVKQVAPKRKYSDLCN